MGMFDSMYVRCPKCKAEIEFQTKTGECGMNSYILGRDSIPPWLEASLAGELFHCTSCDTWFEFDVKVTTKPKILKRKPVWADDAIVWTQYEDEDEDCR